MSSSVTPLTSIILQEANPTLHEYNHALSNIDKYYLKLHDEMQDESNHEQVVLDPTRAVSRLQRSFEILRAKRLPAAVSEELFKSIVLPLIPPQDNIFSLEQSIHLVGSALPLITRHPSPYLRQLAKTLLSVEGLFDHLVSSEQYSVVLKTWLLSKSNQLNFRIVIPVTERLIAMCDACSADHGTVATSESWHTANKLMESLKTLVRSFQEKQQKLNRIEKLPALENMRLLSLNDKKSNHVLQERVQEFSIPERVRDQLCFFNIPLLESVRGLIYALEHLQNETMPSLMRIALESFPCRLCLERLTDASAPFSKMADLSPARTTGTGSAYDIFGKRVGLWKVVLSDAALKGIKKLARAGTFTSVEQKLRELASGSWKGRELSQRAGSKTQKQRMDVPVLQVAVNRTVSILWQIDVGFYDELPWVQQQIVKIWQIVTSENELDAAVGQVIALQKSYSIGYIQLCNKRPVQQADGIFVPQRFGDVRASDSSQLQCINAPNTDQALIEMSNKFYNLTEPFLKSIVQATGREEFPFDLSPEELEIVSHFTTSSLILGRSGTGKTTCILFKMLAKHRARASIPGEQPARQLLLTRSPFLASKLQTYARSLIETQSGSTSTESPSDDAKPASFFALKNEDYPFVCTYDDFLGLLENTIRRADRKDFLKVIDANKSRSVDLHILSKPRVVDFNIFKTEYWGCLAGIAPASCSPELLFAEIMGVIKGSAYSAKTLKSLARAEYIFRGSKASPAFASEAEREKVFVAFERYERQKKLRKEIDELDRVSDLLRVLKNNTILAQVIRRCFEEIYVDEIQDLRCLDIVLFLSCLCDARGIHLAGDTAQCISKDSVFRFPEIKALFYEYYDVIATELKQPCFARPVQFSLAKNYRSHQGILSFASWVMQLLWNGFPETVDKLVPEIGQTGGPKPIIFAGFDSSILSAKMIGLVKLNDQVADFGAEQVILVRDDTSKDKLQSQIGEIALVLTILESKGMEFDDVLVYNFFGSSGLSSSYRCLDLLARAARAQFDSQKHAALCSELKHLYVAVTRARKQLWFMETNENSMDPILQALSESDSLQLAEIVKQKDEDVAERVKVLRAGGSVDPERWLKRAAHLLHQKNFSDALFCYRKASDPRGIAHSQACLFEQEGRACRAANDLERMTTCYEQAIGIFLEIGLFSEAANCYEGLKRYDKIAELWRGQKQYQKAAAWYEKAGLSTAASECYHLTGAYEEAIEVLRRGSQFDHLIDYINRNRENLNANLLHRYSRLCNILLKQGRISSELREKTISLLGSDVDKEAFFKEFEMFDQLRSIYEANGRWIELYELSVFAGNPLSAMNILLTHKLLPVIDQKVIETVLQYALTEILYSQRGLIKARPEGDASLLKTLESTWLEKFAQQWQAAFELIYSFEDENTSTSINQLEDGLLKDILCLFVIANEMHVVTRLRISDLPWDIISRAGKLLQKLEHDDKCSIRCLNLLCGLFNSAGQGKNTVLLSWSPLKLEESASVEDLSPEELLSSAKNWIRGRFATAVARFDESAIHLIKREFPRLCQHLLVKGYCAKQRTRECAGFHEKPTLDTTVSKLTVLLKISEVFARLTPLYLQRVMNEAFQEKFLPRRRRWLEQLIGELTFVTSFEQSATAISTTLSTLQSNQDFLATLHCLEDLLFHRLNREWHEIQSFSAILEQMQQAHLVGFQVACRLRRAVLRKMGYTFSHPRSPITRISISPLKTARGGLLAAEKIRFAVFKRDTSEFYEAVRDFLVNLGKAEMTSLSAFPALLSVLELTITYILCMVNPNNAVVIPWSWALLYLPSIMQTPFADRTLSDREKLGYTSTTMTIMSTFCKVLDNLEFAVNSYEVTFGGTWRRNLPAGFIKRRNVDLLTTVALNMSHWPNAPKGFSDLWVQMHRTLSYFAPPGFSVIGGFQRLRDETIRAYTAYNGKDELHVISLDNKDQPPLYLRGFIENWARFEKLNTFLKISRRAEKSASAFVGGEAADEEEYSGYELDMITNLQRRWRRVMRILEEKRRMRDTLEGRMVLALQNICSSKFCTLPGLSRLSTRDKVCRRKLLFTDGVNILLELEAVSASIGRLKEQCKSQFDIVRSPAELDELDAIRGRIIDIDTRIGQVMDTWSLKGIGSVILLVSVRKLEQSSCEAIRSLWAFRQEIEVVRSQVENFANTSTR